MLFEEFLDQSQKSFDYFKMRSAIFDYLLKGIEHSIKMLSTVVLIHKSYEFIVVRKNRRWSLEKSNLFKWLTGSDRFVRILTCWSLPE